jgi:stage III sporulation protein SpoIIIAA
MEKNGKPMDEVKRHTNSRRSLVSRGANQGLKPKKVMMCDDRAEVSRLAQSKSAHPSTSSGRTDLLLEALPEQSLRDTDEELGFDEPHFT